ncbi:MAG: cold-shock protein [Planctomycetota bacterium]
MKWFDAALGFGFIEDDGGDVFVHRAELEGDECGAGLLAGDIVDYDVRRGPRGIAACRVRVHARLSTAAQSA